MGTLKLYEEIELSELSPELIQKVESICKHEKRDISKILFVSDHPELLLFDMVENYRPTGYCLSIEDNDVD